MHYFPFTEDHFEHQFGIRVLLPTEEIFEKTDRYADEIRTKRELLEILPEQYACLENLPADIEQDASDFVCKQAGFLSAEVADEVVRSKRALLTVARHVQEDLVVVSDHAKLGFPVLGGVVCFPAGWSLPEKIGGSMLQTHAAVPEYEHVLHASVDRLFSQLKVGRPVWRTNWGVRASSNLDQHPRHAERLNTQAFELGQLNDGLNRCGEQAYFRVERQTMSRLPQTRAILFTIHTHQQRVAELDLGQQAKLLGVLKTCPKETLAYKGIAPFANQLIYWLEQNQILRSARNE
jgi:hypothetical protein